MAKCSSMDETPENPGGEDEKAVKLLSLTIKSLRDQTDILEKAVEKM